MTIDMERMGARERRDEAVDALRGRPRRVTKAVLKKVQKAMSEGDAGPYTEPEPEVLE